MINDHVSRKYLKKNHYYIYDKLNLKNNTNIIIRLKFINIIYSVSKVFSET